jgi:uncharacterized repeat protein (TIGR01451 family)
MAVTCARRAREAVVLSAAFALAAMFVSPVNAQGGAPPGDLASVLTQSKVTVGADGKEVLAPAANAAPGDLIEYRVTYTNRGKAAVTGVEASLPVPPGMAYVASSARPEGGLASLGDARFEPIPLKRRVKLADGRTEDREVPATEYKALRWKLGELAAGRSASVSARMRLVPAGTYPPGTAPPQSPPAQGGTR